MKLIIVGRNIDYYGLDRGEFQKATQLKRIKLPAGAILRPIQAGPFGNATESERRRERAKKLRYIGNRPFYSLSASAERSCSFSSLDSSQRGI